DRPGLGEYQRRFPHLAEALRRQFGIHEALASLQADGATSTAADWPAAEAVPARLGPYEVLEEVGRGAMGVVYKARHDLTGRLTALMVIRPGAAPAEERARFLAEAKAVASLNHPNIVQVYEVFAPAGGEGTPFVALEYVAGGSLEAHIAGTPLPPR